MALKTRGELYMQAWKLVTEMHELDKLEVRVAQIRALKGIKEAWDRDGHTNFASGERLAGMLDSTAGP